MRTLFRYLRLQWPVAFLAMSLAAVNQIFSLLDPLIFRHINGTPAGQVIESGRPGTDYPGAGHRHPEGKAREA